VHPDELKEKILNIRIWQRGDERAPHKPLLLLYCLARVARGEPRLVSYEEAVDDLRKLLKEFGPYRKIHYPSYPFVKLCNDGGFWEIKGNRVLNTTRDWSDQDLIQNNTSGGFTVEVYELLKKEKNLVKELASLILNQYFLKTLHKDIITRVGLDLETGARRHSPGFRNRLHRVYEYAINVVSQIWDTFKIVLIPILRIIRHISQKLDDIYRDAIDLLFALKSEQNNTDRDEEDDYEFCEVVLPGEVESFQIMRNYLIAALTEYTDKCRSKRIMDFNTAIREYFEAFARGIEPEEEFYFSFDLKSDPFGTRYINFEFEKSILEIICGGSTYNGYCGSDCYTAWHYTIRLYNLDYEINENIICTEYLPSIIDFVRSGARLTISMPDEYIVSATP
jgi:hypothetical protein